MSFMTRQEWIFEALLLTHVAAVASLILGLYAAHDGWQNAYANAQALYPNIDQFFDRTHYASISWIEHTGFARYVWMDPHSILFTFAHISVIAGSGFALLRLWPTEQV